ncbi:NotI family restriction endonuclease [Gloeobacter kilaueensis]|uniref:Restriction endonuclease type II NotI domain-containing protein n=1 Tax=Gloeobacter kilaueensis (strain ATCC BAA-2537 / CCAP 1431/1 / ULC 316 / JS1) TaxID=1183438 RepID=U5QCS6_GLOK1|nr:NotI family restriction endonuclease [Gloeobacter kilaueensis]AGY56681.1 hypothetical protein GKIL_0435 [Gloeobacter kilaueensis JS1]
MTQKAKEQQQPTAIPNPLHEVFGFPPDMIDEEALRYRNSKYCPFGNGRSRHCTKSKATDPIGVCSIYRDNTATITCPVRFRQNGLIGNHTSAFFFQGIKNPDFRLLTEVKLRDAAGNPVGIIDAVVVRLENGRIVDYGAVEVQGTYISGNVTNPFKKYMSDQVANATMLWPKKSAPRADYLSSSRKRLVPQLLYKGRILKSWNRKIAVVVDQPFFKDLFRITPFEHLQDPVCADMAWFIYGLQRDEARTQYTLTLNNVVYTEFLKTLERINTPISGDESQFIKQLQSRIDAGELSGIPEEVELTPDLDAPVTFDNNE